MLRRMTLALTICTLAGAAAAQEPRDSFVVDFAALFRDKADEVQDETREGGPRTRVLQLGPVTVTELENENATEYLAVDRSPEGAVGCLMQVLASLRQVAPCDGVMSELQNARIEGAFDKVLSFYVANTWPPVPVTDRAAALARLHADFDAALAPGDEVCPTMADANRLAEAQRFAAALADGAEKGAVEQMLATPRLPVTNPCQ